MIMMRFVGLFGLFQIAFSYDCDQHHQTTLCRNVEFHHSESLLLENQTESLILLNPKGIIDESILKQLEIKELTIQCGDDTKIGSKSICTGNSSLVKFSLNNLPSNPIKLPLKLFENCANLRDVYINNAILENDAFDPTVNLEFVILNNTKFTGDFPKSLKSLWIKYSNLTELNVNLGALHTLDVSDNGIENITDLNLKNLPKLSVLNLAGNQITFINDGDFVGAEHVHALFLDHNPLRGVVDAKAFETFKYLERVIIAWESVRDAEEFVKKLSNQKTNVIFIGNK